MIENDLITPGDHKSTLREIEDLRTKLEGSEVLRWLEEHALGFPTTVDDPDPELAKSTLMGRLRQWVAARRKPGLGGLAGESSNEQKPTAMFLKQVLLNGQKDKNLCNKVEKMLRKGDALPSPTEAANAFDDRGEEVSSCSQWRQRQGCR